MVQREESYSESPVNFLHRPAHPSSYYSETHPAIASSGNKFPPATGDDDDDDRKLVCTEGYVTPMR